MAFGGYLRKLGDGQNAGAAREEIHAPSSSLRSGTEAVLPMPTAGYRYRHRALESLTFCATPMKIYMGSSCR